MSSFLIDLDTFVVSTCFSVLLIFSPFPVTFIIELSKDFIFIYN